MKIYALVALLLLPLGLVLGCSSGQPTVVVDDRPAEVVQAENDDYDKQMAEDAKSYEEQQGAN